METMDWKWNAADGTELYARAWTPTGSPKGVLVLVHGLGEHVGRYEHVGAALTEGGYALAGFDLRGHGKSAGTRGHTPDYEALMDDITGFLVQVRERFPSIPQFLYGHSLGANLAINYGMRRKSDLHGVIATGVWLRLAFQPPESKVRLARVMNKIMPSYTQGNGLIVKGLSRDQKVVTDYVNDPLVHDRISARMFLSIYDAGLWALEHAGEFNLPLLLMYGEQDPITSPKSGVEFAQKADKLVTVKIWEGLYHEVHNEPEKKDVFRFMLDWLDKN